MAGPPEFHLQGRGPQQKHDEPATRAQTDARQRHSVKNAKHPVVLVVVVVVVVVYYYDEH